MRRLVPLLALVAGCSAGFDPSSWLKPGTLRVLGVVAQPVVIADGQPVFQDGDGHGLVSEIASGGQVQLSVISPAIDGVTTTYQWAICTDPPPPGTADVNDDCLKDDTASFLIPVTQLSSDTSKAIITWPAGESMATLGVPDVSGGFYLPVRIRATAGSQRVDTVYGVRLTLPELPPNHNPTITNCEHVDAPLDASPMDVTELSTDKSKPTPVQAGTEPVIRLLLSSDSYETFPELTGTPPNTMITTETEEPRFLWYASAGELSQDTTGMAQPDTKLRLDHDRMPSVGQLIDLWVVVHDDRSGTAFTERWLVVQ